MQTIPPPPRQKRKERKTFSFRVKVKTKRWYPLQMTLIGFAIVWNFLFDGACIWRKGRVAASREKDRCKKVCSDTCRLKYAWLKTDKTSTLWHHQCIQLHTLKKLLQSSPRANDRICRTPLFQRHARVVIESFTAISEISKHEEDILWKVIPTLFEKGL